MLIVDVIIIIVAIYFYTFLLLTHYIVRESIRFINVCILITVLRRTTKIWLEK